MSYTLPHIYEDDAPARPAEAALLDDVTPPFDGHLTFSPELVGLLELLNENAEEHDTPDEEAEAEIGRLLEAAREAAA